MDAQCCHGSEPFSVFDVSRFICLRTRSVAFAGVIALEFTLVFSVRLVARNVQMPSTMSNRLICAGSHTTGSAVVALGSCETV